MAVGNRWLGRGAVKLHVAAFLAVAGCLAAFWWQLGRALHGNTLSWAYAVEWPFFAAYAVWMWWRLLREEPGFSRGDAEAPAGEGTAAAPARDTPIQADGDDDADYRAWVAYNEYLARLSEANRQPRS